MKPSEIAKICHEVNRGLCFGLGDYSQTSWEVAPDWQKDSAMDGVEAILRGAITKPEDSHENWLQAKHAEGWKWGAVKDPDKKEHPCMVAFDELPPEQQLKDTLFFATVQALR
jgi:hypothetical protein